MSVTSIKFNFVSVVVYLKYDLVLHLYNKIFKLIPHKFLLFRNCLRGIVRKPEAFLNNNN